jgi:hypothetical protein
MEKSVSEQIALLAAAQRAGKECHDWQQELAERFGGLAVYGDLGGALVLRPDGSALGLGWDDEKAAEPSPGWRIIALAAASYQFPELAALAPERPPGAHPCWLCAGAGCESCFGLGWLPDLTADDSVAHAGPRRPGNLGG